MINQSVITCPNMVCAQHIHGGADGPAYGFSFVAAKIVDDDDVASPERGHQDLFDIGELADPVDGAVDGARR